jgi:hypothetical protein
MSLLHSNNDDGDAVSEIINSFETGTITSNIKSTNVRDKKITYQRIKSL